MGALPAVGFIGAGRLAHALALALRRAGYPIAAVASRSRASADRLAAAVVDIAEAHRRMEANANAGKIVIRV